MKIIVAAPPIPGETLPLLQLAKALAGRGHQVTMLAGSGFRAAAEEAGLTFASLRGAADYDVADLVAGREGLPPGPVQLNFDWISSFINPMPAEHEALQDLLAADPDQHLIANVLFLGALPVACGAPGLRPRRWVGVSVVPLPLSSDDTSFMGPVPVGPGDDQRAANRAANAEFAAALAPSRERLEDVLREMGADAVPDSAFTDTIILAPDATAALTVPGFEFHRSDLPETVHLVGLLPALQTDGWEPPAWWQELDGRRPVVVVTQGTLANHDLGQLIEPALTGLAGLDVTVVAALGGPKALSIPTPDNARVEAFVPFDRLLPRADVLVTNGGSGGVHQALAAGVPVVVAGETEDKPANAARVAYHGLGVNLGTATPTPGAVAEAVRALLGDGEIRENVRQLAKVYSEHDPVDGIERLLFS
ncbi:glycosyltransferase [Cryptosporangium sp. NPDC048952]|uniref:glycosyltransferase n=1 Tax=Cryptosporangium sp. NPDC048952 TaxID=3363961 RepID=UPI00371A2C87